MGVIVSKKALLILGVSLVCTVAGLLLWKLPIDVTVHEPGFKILKYKFSKGEHHALYPGNQAFGKLNAWMEVNWSVNFIGDTRLEVRTGPDQKLFLVRFAGRPNDYSLYFATAVLELPGGDKTGLPCCSRVESRNGFGAAYILPTLSARAGPFQIHLTRTNSETALATWRIKRLD